MTAMIGFPAALLIGFAFGRGAKQLVAAGLVWYLALAWQTAFIAHLGRNAFGGKSGLATVQWWVYWAVQPLLLGAAFALLWAGSRVRAGVRRRLPAQHGTA